MIAGAAEKRGAVAQARIDEAPRVAEEFNRGVPSRQLELDAAQSHDERASYCSGRYRGPSGASSMSAICSLSSSTRSCQ